MANLEIKIPEDWLSQPTVDGYGFAHYENAPVWFLDTEMKKRLLSRDSNLRKYAAVKYLRSKGICADAGDEEKRRARLVSGNLIFIVDRREQYKKRLAQHNKWMGE